MRIVRWAIAGGLYVGAALLVWLLVTHGRPRSSARSPAEEKPTPKAEFTALFDADRRLRAGQTTPLYFRLVEASTKRPLRPQEVSVLLFKPPGTWQRGVVPQEVEDGVMEVSFTPPTSGEYQLLVGPRTPGSPLDTLPPVTLRVGPAEEHPSAPLQVEETPP